jgi:hypothetical protein
MAQIPGDGAALRKGFRLGLHGIFAISLLFQMTDTRMLVVHCGLYKVAEDIAKFGVKLMCSVLI